LPKACEAEKALVNHEGDPLKSGPGFNEVELVLESLVNFFGGVTKQSIVVHKENVFVAYRNVVDEELKEHDTERGALW
jgi:hypothetical protein